MQDYNYGKFTAGERKLGDLHLTVGLTDLSF